MNHPDTQPQESLWHRIVNEPRYRAIGIQLSVFIVLAWLVWVGVTNTAQNLKQAGIASGFGFLEQPAGFDVSLSFIDFSRNSTYFRAYLVGLANTLVMTALCIVTSTVVGFVTAVLRLSPNWLMSRLAGTYVEIARNIPLILLILFVYLALLSPLPSPRQALNLWDLFFLSNRGLIMPWPLWQAGAKLVFAAIFVACALCVAVSLWAKKRQRRTGQTFPLALVNVALLLAVPLCASLLSDTPLVWDIPKLTGFNFQGGLTVLPEFLALCLAMTIYMGAFIGENIRSGILAVPHGQIEAAGALGLRPGAIMRLVIIPQALRVIIPPVASQYLTLAKNISLGVVIGYPDIISVFAGTTLNQTGQAVEVIAITMLTYLGISLFISLLMLWYENAVSIKER